MDQEIEEVRVIQIPVAHMVANLHAHAACSDGAGRLCAGKPRVLQRHLRERPEPVRMSGTERERLVVHLGGPVGRSRRVPCVAEHHGRCAYQLHGNAMGVEFGNAEIGIPERAVDRPERLVGEHDLASLAGWVDGKPWRALRVDRLRFLAANGRKEMRVDIDHVKFLVSVRCQALKSCPG